MSLLGHGVLAIWNNLHPDAQTDFCAWHGREHVPERLSVPGFLRVRRFVAQDAAPAFFTLYETETVETLSSAPYLEQAQAPPSPWASRLDEHFEPVARWVCRVDETRGRGDGGLLATVRFQVQPAELDELRNRARRLLARLGDCNWVAACHWLSADTAEPRRRQGADASAMLIIESWADAPGFSSQCEAILSESFEGERFGPADVACFRLQYSCPK